MQLRILTAADVRRALPMATAVAVMKEAFRQYSSGEAEVPLRSRLEVPSHDGLTLVMPAYLRQTGEMAVKIVSVFSRNPDRGLPTVLAAVIVVDSETGQPVALLEGGSLTALRTGAASGAATDILARPDSRTLALFGSGAQARTQLEAVCAVRPIEQVWVYSLDLDGARRMVEELGGQGPIPRDIRLASSAGEAAERADIVCTATTSASPVFPDGAIRDGTHINAIGSYTPTMQEIDPQTVRRALLVVDSREAALAETGDLIQPIRAGVFTPDHIHAELGEVLSGKAPGRTEAAQITLFKSVGLAVQDAVAAGRALARAAELGLGQTVEL
jgi:ornithine cyclodeaminase